MPRIKVSSEINMPETPDLIYIERCLNDSLKGAHVAAVRVGDPTPLRIMLPGQIQDLLPGTHLLEVGRRGHFLRFAFANDLVMVINAMLVGRYAVVPTADTKPERKMASLIVALQFEDNVQLQYLDSKRMGKVYLAALSNELEIPVYGSLGVDVMSAAFTFDAFMKVAKKRRDQVRNFLMDKEALASIGNAYADEILFDARLHPKTFCHQLKPEDWQRLYDSVRSTLNGATEHILAARPPVSEKLRDFLNVRGRAGKPCPRCATTLRSVRVGVADADFCPTCQPAQRALFIDWNHKPEPK